MLNPLLIQLFGRDVVDHLEDAGLDSEQAIARLGAEDLGVRADLTPDIARRVVALAVELSGTSGAPRARRGASTTARKAKPAPRTKRKSRAKPAPAQPDAPLDRAAAPVERSAAPSDPVDSDPDEEDPAPPVLQQTAHEDFTFVDEAGLIAWMGFASRTGAEGSLRSSVADGILEPAAPSQADPPRSPTPAAGSEPASPRPESPTPGNSNSVLLEGSFWGFGGRPHSGVTVSPASCDEADRSRSQPARPVPFHRRRSHDGH